MDEIERAMGLLAEQLGAVPVTLEVVQVQLFAPRVTPRDGDALKELFREFPGDHPVEIVVSNGMDGQTLMAVEARVSLEIKPALAAHFGAWAVL